MKWQYHECPSLRTVGGGKVAAIVTEDGFTVCEPMPLETAQQIIREHNAHDDLVKALGAAQSALRSFQYGNASADFAKDMADNCDTALAKAGAA